MGLDIVASQIQYIPGTTLKLVSTPQFILQVLLNCVEYFDLEVEF